MCDPVSAVAIALSVASAGAGLYHAQVAADEKNAQIDYANRIKAENTARANQAANQQIEQTQAQFQAEVEDELDAGFEDALIGRQREAEVINAAESGGVQGLSVFEVVDDLNAYASRQELNTAQNIDDAQTQLGFQFQEIENRRFAAIQSNRPDMNVSGVGAGDFISAGLEIGGTIAKRGAKKGWFGGGPEIEYHP